MSETIGPDNITSTTINGRRCILRNCNYCGIEYYARLDSLKAGKGIYCSKECSRQMKKVHTPQKDFVLFSFIDMTSIYYDGDRYFIFVNGKYKYPTRRYGTIKKCEFCNDIFFALNDVADCCSAKCAAKNRFKNHTISDNVYLPDVIRKIAMYTEWRNAVYARDNYTCQLCGDATGGNLNAHHIDRFIDIIMRNHITNLQEARECKELWDISNGIALCDICHRKVHSNATK